MKTLILTKDFRQGEDISEHCRSLASYLDQQGVEVQVVCFNNGNTIEMDQVPVHEVDFILDGDNIYDWTMLMNNELKRVARGLVEDVEFDLIHAHEWTTLPAGITLKKLLEKPLAITIHSTENNRGFGGPHGALISEMEYRGTKEADLIIAPNHKVANSLKFDLDCSPEKLVQVDPFSTGWRQQVYEQYQRLSDRQ